jgi:hypothetical protein
VEQVEAGPDDVITVDDQVHVAGLDLGLEARQRFDLDRDGARLGREDDELDAGKELIEPAVELARDQSDEEVARRLDTCQTDPAPGRSEMGPAQVALVVPARHVSRATRSWSESR